MIEFGLWQVNLVLALLLAILVLTTATTGSRSIISHSLTVLGCDSVWLRILILLLSLLSHWLSLLVWLKSLLEICEVSLISINLLILLLGFIWCLDLWWNVVLDQFMEFINIKTVGMIIFVCGFARSWSWIIINWWFLRFLIFIGL